MTFQLMDSYNAQNLRLTPAAFYPLNDRSGTTAVDLSKNGYSATYAGSGVTLAQAGPIKGEPNALSVLLNGSTGDAACPAGLSTAGWSAFTMLAWFKLSNNTFTNYPNVAGNDGNAAGFNVVIAPSSDGSTAYFNIFTSAKNSLSYGTTVLAANAWFYSATTWDGTTMKWYQNGSTTPVGTLAASGTIATTANHVYLGNNPRDTTSYQFPGDLAGIMLISRALTLDEIQAIWHFSQAGKIWMGADA